jgi:hypothetical protein
MIHSINHSVTNCNAPWGVTETPAGFGSFPNAILVGNFGDGTINAYDQPESFSGNSPTHRTTPW